jgi:hypothetical protein
MSEKRLVSNNYKTARGNSIVITDTLLNSNKEHIILDLSSSELANPNSYMYEREVNFGKKTYSSSTSFANRRYSVTLTIKLNKVDGWSSCNLRFIKLKLVDMFGVKQTNTSVNIGFTLYIKLVDLNNEIVQISNGNASGTYTLIDNVIVSSRSPIIAGSLDGTYLIDLADKTIKSYTNNLLLKALCVKDILNPNYDSLTKDINPGQSTLTDNIARAFLNNTYRYTSVKITDYPEYLGIQNKCTFNIYDKNYAPEDVLLGNVNILKPDDILPVAGTSANLSNLTTYNLYINQPQPINDAYYFRFILTTINGVPQFKNVGRYSCIINYNFQFGVETDIRTYTFSAKIEPNATFRPPTQFLIDIQEDKYLPFKQTTISYSLNPTTVYRDILNYVIAEPFIDKPAADYIVEPIGDWDYEDNGENESNTGEGDL